MRKGFTTSNLYDCGFAGILMLMIGIVLGAALVGGGYYGYQQQQKSQIMAINSFEECAKYFPVMESYPAQCNTPDGKHFIQQLSEEEKKKLMPPVEDESNNWKTFENNDFSFKYPSNGDWMLYQDGSNYIVRVACQQCRGEDNLRGFSINKVPFKTVDDYLKSNPDQINSIPIPLDKKQVKLNGLESVQILVPPYHGIGLIEFFVNHNGQGYVLIYEGLSSSSNKLQDLPLPKPDILSTFKFIDSTSTSYVCPKTEYVNCMPIVPPERQEECSPDYLQWAKNNCPGFQGAAY
jgi:hypothetical protein